MTILLTILYIWIGCGIVALILMAIPDLYRWLFQKPLIFDPHRGNHGLALILGILIIVAGPYPLVWVIWNFFDELNTEKRHKKEHKHWDGRNYK